MAYPLETDKNITNDIIKRKEFYKLKLIKKDDKKNVEHSIIPRFMLNKLILESDYLRLQSYQTFITNYINPNTSYTRLLVKWSTGSGKTATAISVAMNFIKYYQMDSEQGYSNIGSVYIIGFTKSIFKRELLKFPEFGFISRVELDKLNKLKLNALNGGRNEIEKYHEFISKIQKRFSDRTKSGFFKFIGYKELVNILFNINSNTENININKLSDSEIKKAIDDKKIEINVSFINGFKNSLIICDEIHNVYNSIDKNNWGIALQYILDSHPSIRALFMSATPLNNSPVEIVDLLNLLLPSTYYNKIKKLDFFGDNKMLKPNALSTIEKLCKGRISFVRDVNPLYIPTSEIIGEKINGIDYIKFIRSPMSTFHYNTYKESFTGVLSQDSIYLQDFALPNPHSQTVGMFQTQIVKKNLENAPKNWKDQNKITITNDVITGDILLRENLSKISTKYVAMLDEVLDIINLQKGKIIIYHNIIHMSGVLFIKEILLKNNILDEYSDSNDNTLCVTCGKPRKNHNAESLIITGGIDHQLLDGIMLENIYIISNYDIKDKIQFETKLQNTISEIKEPIILEINNINTEYANILKKNKFKIYDINNGSSKAIYYYNIQNIKLYKIKDIKKIIKQSYERKPYNTNIIHGGDKHKFLPVRFVVMHSDIEQHQRNTTMEKFNSNNNSDGGKFMILIGGRMIKESLDIKAVRNILIMGRPDNISALIQIIGRAVRKFSHKFLPKSQRHVIIKIFTSCLPKKYKSGINKGKNIMGYEEQKYSEKITSFKIIQKIEKILHENAIDSVINYDIIWNVDEKKLLKGETNKNNMTLGPLEYKSKNISQFKASELNLSTFSTFHVNKEITDIVLILKRLFIEISPVWTYVDLLNMVKTYNNNLIEFNTSLISENLFISALNKLVWSGSSTYVEPILNSTSDKLTNVLNKLFDPSDKILLLPDGQDSIIKQIGEFYILFPYDNIDNSPISSVESFYRITNTDEDKKIDIKSFLSRGEDISDYEDRKNRYYIKWNNTPIINLELAVCDFGIDFHIRFLEECIEYVFNVWTNVKVKKNILHPFYFKMLNYYDIRKIIIWGHTSKKYIADMYTKYIVPIDVKIKDTSMALDNTNEKQKKPDDILSAAASSGIINLLKSSINRSSQHWVSSGLQEQFNSSLEKSLDLFDGDYIKKRIFKKVPADILPIGHLLNKIPRFYLPDRGGWFDSPEYLDLDGEFVENNLVIGYDERTSTGINIRFKIRNPIHNIKQYKDTRMIEKGSVCSSKSKFYLLEISRKLGVKIKDKINVLNLCNDIRTKLIYLELKERTSKSKVKYFYFIYEKRPETILFN
jgi:hypothetical protein